nr:hypothetical protein BaRGS_033717 [Batillaria attramentaria]
MALLTSLLEPTTLLLGSVLALSLLWLKATRRPRGLPPGPGPALPLLGHLHLLEKDIRPVIEKWRRQYGDIISFYMGSQLVVVLNGYDVIKDAFVKHADAFSDRPHMFITDEISKGKGVISTSGQLWKEQRKVSLEVLRELGLGKNVLAEKIQEEVALYVKALYSNHGQPMDIKRMTQISVSNNICSIVFGKRFEYDDPTFTSYLRRVDQNVEALTGAGLVTCFPWMRYLPGDLLKFKRTLTNVDAVNEELIKPRVRDHFNSFTDGEASDFIYAYIREMRKREDSAQATTLDDENLITTVGDLFVAGTESTSTAISWAVVLLENYPDAQEKCFQEIQRVIGTARPPSMRDKPDLTYVEATIMEVLRWANIAIFALQHAVPYDVSFRGYTIPKEAMIMPNLESVLQDEQTWGDPLVFRPDRFIGPDGKLTRPDEFIPFGIDFSLPACLTVSVSQELLTNEGFESLEHWDCWEQTCSLSDEKHSGQHAVHTTDRQHDYDGPSQYVSINPGETYAVTGWAKLGDDGGTGQDLILEFDFTVQGGSHEWVKVAKLPGGQKNYDDALTMIHGLKAHGLKVRGHNLVWSVDQFVQDWVKQLWGDDLRKAVKDHIEETMDKTRGLLEHWDVNNENLHGSWYQTRLNDNDYAIELFRIAHNADPSVKLFLNDYNVVAWGGDTDSRLDHLAQAGIPIWITELDVQAWDENKRADFYESALRTFYEHPAVEGILFWGFWDKQHWRGDKAALIRGDNFELTAAGRRVLDLFENQWMTDETRSLTSLGDQFTVRGFHGDYEVNVIYQGRELEQSKETFELGKASKWITINVQTS